MSRYIVKDPKDTKRSFTYGYDRPLQYYFFAVEKDGKVIDSDKFAGCTGGQVLEKAEEHGFALPEEHTTAMALDLTF